ncbi:WhiB family transcriptional regulator [Amycolatopsis regifaucium]|uniref:Transcriptional regulator WhiB n=1 Tax=Amycolatopsis regifaucium TaxID=546365 RepID=A0A154MGQ7_9PSEU|nr:WhiB family transcriptional regulator [Amycolatopsis regifaucium]KZB83622.1 transcriptional regulator [Amycolatopsis regifaucium]OKA03860.1 transcriptional regulator [Amycolatopsis regifaucium]SFJ65664.1 WhiB family transcriptional regulator, redox-sensing transcriptional regulator [Amycolatopsis regifaucium]
METRMAGELRKAACRSEDPELFFPVTEIGPGARQVARAKAVCARCPVTSACLAYALDNGLDHGVFGGLTDSERRRPIHVRSAA